MSGIFDHDELGKSLQLVAMTTTKTGTDIKISTKLAIFPFPVVGHYCSCLDSWTQFHRARRGQKTQIYRCDFDDVCYSCKDLLPVLAAIMLFVVIGRYCSLLSTIFIIASCDQIPQMCRGNFDHDSQSYTEIKHFPVFAATLPFPA